MEPDFDKLLSNKIHDAETKVVSWNKQAVWQKVQSETKAKRRFNYVYYAAAALVFLVLCFGAHVISNTKDPLIADVKLASPQGEPKPGTESATQLKNHSASKEPVEEKLKNDASVPARKIPKSIQRPNLSASSKSKAVDGEMIAVVTDTTINENNFPLTDKVMIHEQKIRPIVGVITEASSVDVTKVRRRKSLRKLDSPESPPWQNTPNALVFARKK